ncbi:putative lipoyltransferase 2, mitochondrial isoform X2 [Labeo rohita]|uniref:putative lipoyltransferase 2, mitochondrial isoform X2 n=1 Tax=Labeo rohita TaxID=84645 RepID=UPI0021E34620|nr:putative lipoyltransferase 2, mitochondrial isoform X2 [Labeo rohita]
MTVGKTAVKVVHLGRISYHGALKVQQQHIKQHLDLSSTNPNTLLLCEHEPVYTIGIRQAPYPPKEEQRLKALGADFFRTNRGGLITFHGPGQLVCYPILNLGCFKKSVRWYVCELEKTVINMCSKFGIEATTSPDTGVWVSNNKICAIGLNENTHRTPFHLFVSKTKFKRRLRYSIMLFCRYSLWKIYHLPWTGS